VSRKNSNRGARTRACRVHTRVNARRVFARVQPLTPFWVRARPRIVLHLRHQSRLDRIPFNVSRDPVPFIFVTHPVIIRFTSPKLLSGSPQQLIRFSRGKSFERLEQFARGYQRKQQHVDMIYHDCKRSKLVVPEFCALEERINHSLRDGIQLEERWAGPGFIQVAIHPDKGFTRSTFARRREPRAWQTAVQVPGDKKPATLRVVVRKSALRVYTTISAISPRKISVAHALLRTQAVGKTQGVHTSVNAARRSACAT
jgi:hypothetical protein